MIHILRWVSTKRVLFLGSDQISEICLRTLLEDFPNYEFSLITTSETNPPAKLAKTKNLQTFIESKGRMQDWKILSQSSSLWQTPYNFLVSASFGYLIPNSLISFCEHSLNFHPSLLPKYRGSSPIQYALYNNDEYTGVSIITIDPDRFDNGLILKQVKFSSNIQKETYASLSVKLAQLGGQCLSEVIKDYENFLKAATKQDTSESSNAFKLAPDFAKLTFNSSEELFNRFRSVFGTSLNPYFLLESRRVLVLAMRQVLEEELKFLSTNYPKAVPGSIWLIYPGLGKMKSVKFFKSIEKIVYLKTFDGWIAITDLIQAGHSKEGRFVDFVEANFDIQAYISQKSFEKVTGIDLRFE